ncbi:hypothetical protein Q3G72_023394 [Acer saccharum]|nr:hypothetical protein Q3G72_023394 [Acer saccharum]
MVAPKRIVVTNGKCWKVKGKMSSVGLKGHKGHRQFLYGDCSYKNQKHVRLEELPVTSSYGGSSDKERRQSMGERKDSGSTMEVLGVKCWD